MSLRQENESPKVERQGIRDTWIGALVQALHDERLRRPRGCLRGLRRPWRWARICRRWRAPRSIARPARRAVRLRAGGRGSAQAARLRRCVWRQLLGRLRKPTDRDGGRRASARRRGRNGGIDLVLIAVFGQAVFCHVRQGGPGFEGSRVAPWGRLHRPKSESATTRPDWLPVTGGSLPMPVPAANRFTGTAVSRKCHSY